MIPIYENPSPALYFRAMNEDGKNVEKAVDDIIAAVRSRGDAALKEYTARFDGVALESLEVSEAEIAQAWEATDASFRQVLLQARDHIHTYHSAQKREGFILSQRPGVVLGQRITPLARVGVYVPGGTAAYPSTVLMNVIPALIAGVPEIIMVTPPGKNGKVVPGILAAAKAAGVTRIFKVGGAQAVAALAYGTESIPQVDKIVGPGNIYVATAKRRVFGQVDIDMVAGPSEILVVADEKTNAAQAAADLLSQAEHDVLSRAILVTTSLSLAQQVQQEVETQLEKLPRAAICRKSIDNNSMILVTSTLEEAVQISNEIAPEHLELCVDDPFGLLGRVTNAGSIFLGRNAPEALGDYFAGPNHTLPTSGRARFSSPLSVDDFIKKSSYIYYSRDALLQECDDIARFAMEEGLQAHAASVLSRKGDA